MFRLLFLLLLCIVLPFQGEVFATDERAPQIVCRNARGHIVELDLKNYAVAVERHLDLVETTLTLTFNNETYIRLEGELLLPLPPNATISSYALEINGEFREAVAVEKKRARLAYETIKARKVDPGIVEKEADGLYRTRIYPIMPRSTKGFRISYLEYLPITGPAPFRPSYRLPFNLTTTVENISVEIKNPGSDDIKHSSLEFLKNASGHKEAILENSTLKGTLTIEATDPHRPSAAIASTQPGLAYLSLNSNLARKKDQGPHPSPKKVGLLWDASRSMAGTDFTKTTQYLDSFFQAHPDLTIVLSFLRNIREEAGEFQIKGGNWEPLREAISNASYDGSSNYTDLTTEGCEFTLLVTDGLATHWGPDITKRIPKVPLVALSLREILPLSPLGNLAFRSGGRVLNLSNLDKEEALKLTFEPPFQLPFPTPGIDVIPLASLPPFVHRFLLRERSGSDSRLKAALKKLDIQSEDISPRWLAHLFGVTHLQQLESSNASPLEIIAHCEKHTLASDFTSLIVLENFADHLEFEIPPPEADQLARYQAAIERKRNSAEERLRWVWAEVLKRHRRKAPGIEIQIYNELARIQKHNQAQAYAFEPEQLDPTTRKAFLTWEEQVLELLKRREEAKDDTKKEKWKEELFHLRKEAQNLTSMTPSIRTPLAVSIRGFVAQPGTIEFERPVTLKYALAHARVPNREDLGRVALYRSGKKTTYNTLSDDFREFALLSGDMIVVEGTGGHVTLGSSDDPFASSDPFFGNGPEENPSLFAGQPAVIDDGAAGGIPAQKIPESVFNRDLNALGINKEKNPNTNESALDPIPIVIRSLALFKEGQIDKAKRHLSNLRELFPRQGSALRLEALALWQMNEITKAQAVLNEALNTNKTDYLAANLLAAIALTHQESGAQEAKKAYNSILESAWGRDEFTAQTILLTDRNSLLDSGPATARESKLPKDLRVVITNLQPDPSFQTTVLDPTTFRTHGGEISPTGVINVETLGLHEITDKETIEGKYFIEAQCERAQILLVSTYQNFSSPHQTSKHDIFILKGGKEPETIQTISCK